MSTFLPDLDETIKAQKKIHVKYICPTKPAMKLVEKPLNHVYLRSKPKNQHILIQEGGSGWRWGKGSLRGERERNRDGEEGRETGFEAGIERGRWRGRGKREGEGRRSRKGEMEGDIGEGEGWIGRGRHMERRGREGGEGVGGSWLRVRGRGKRRER